jgi:hypothetical protein
MAKAGAIKEREYGIVNLHKRANAESVDRMELGVAM